MKNRKLLLIPLLALLLAGCQPTTSDSTLSSEPPVSEPGSDDPSSDNPSSDDPSSDVVSEVVSSESSLPSSSENSSEPPSSSDLPPEELNNYYKLEQGVNYDNRALDVASGLTALNSIGEQKLLVVPVVFADGSSTSRATPENHEMIQKVFFGESEETGWESVASYYHKSSYGRLTLTGEVQDYFYLPYSTAEFLDFEISKGQDFGNPNNYWDETHHVIRTIYDTYDAELLKDYDLDGDGHVDALWMVYMYPHVVSDEPTPLWAYKFYWNQFPDVDKPTPNTYAWASYDFANEGKGYTYSSPDAHTFIHETGHMFGLNDYYDYDGFTAPAGKVDMMDNNVIDHNAYSKFLLNWVEPYIVTGNANITLRPTESFGDVILLKNDWNGHAYDEYILMEFYTPTGLNEKDSQNNGYASKGSNSGVQGYTIPGVRMWHVDSRLVRYAARSYTWIDEIEPDTEETTTIIGPTNTVSSRRHIKEEYRLLHLMDAAGVTSKVSNWLKTPTVSTDKALFVEGKVIKADDWGKYLQTEKVGNIRPTLFNDGTNVGYRVEIGELNESGVTIKLRVA